AGHGRGSELSEKRPLKNARASWALVMAWKYEIALRLLSKQPRMKRADRPRCGARTRKGRPCRAPAVWDCGKDQARNGRCRLHGGRSTGPRTTAGRDAIRASNRRRAFRENAG